MKTLKRALLALIVLLVLVAGATFGLMLHMGAPTQGPRISAYQSPKTAVLVVDIQEDFTGPKAKKPYRDAERIVKSSNELIAGAQQHGAQVVFIANVVDNPILSVLTGGLNAPGSPGAEMDRRLVRLPGTPTFTKNRGDAFSNAQFDAYLRANQIERLLIVGLDAAYCVTATTRGARNRGYKVVVLTEGVATESGKSLESLSEGWREAGAEVEPAMRW